MHTTTFSHTEQTVLVLIPPGARVTFDSPGLFDLPLPYRSFKHVDKHLPRNDEVKHGGYESLPLLCLKALYLVTWPTNLQMFLFCNLCILATVVLLRICHQGGWVLDLCCGSGSDVIAALRMGHNAMGVDVSKGQVEGTTARVKMFAVEGSSFCSTANGYAFLTFCFYLHWMVGQLLAKRFAFLTHCYGSFCQLQCKHCVAVVA